MRRYFAAIALLFACCQKAEVRPPNTLVVNLGAEPKTVDPRKARDLNDTTLCKMLYEGLVRLSKEGGVELALAEKVDVLDDGKTYQFSLRDSVWSDGTPVTSFDFARTWRSILDPAFPTDIAYQLYPILNGRKAKLGEVSVDEVGIETPDPRTLVVRLEQPLPYFLDVCSMSSFLPYSKTRSNGPFSLALWDHADRIRVEKNKRYWDAGSIHLDAIEFLMVSNDTEIRMFEEKKLDWAGSPLSTIPQAAAAELKKADQLKASPLLGTYFYRVNVASEINGKKNPLADPKVRRVLAAAIDREGIAAHVLQGGQMPAYSLVPPEMGLGKKEIEDGLKLEIDAPIELSFAIDDRNLAVAQAIQAKWEKDLGVKVVLRPQEPKVFSEMKKNGKYQIAAGSWIADFNDPVNFLEVFKYKDGSTNNTGWEDSKYIELLNSSALCRDQDKRRLLMSDAEAVLMEQMPIIPIFHFAINYLQSSQVSDIALSPIGQIDFRWARIEESNTSCR